MRRIRTTGVAGAAVAALALPARPAATASAAPTAATTACPTGWGSLPKVSSTATTTPVENIRAGRHACYDRMVVDLPGAGTSGLGYSVRYVSKLYQDGSGRPIPVAGGAVLEIRVAAPAYDHETGAPTYPGRVSRPLPGIDLAGYRTFRDARYGGSFEGETLVGLGVRARLPFRVLVLTDRIVVDVAHNWTGAR